MPTNDPFSENQIINIDRLSEGFRGMTPERGASMGQATPYALASKHFSGVIPVVKSVFQRDFKVIWKDEQYLRQKFMSSFWRDFRPHLVDW